MDSISKSFDNHASCAATSHDQPSPLDSKNLGELQGASITVVSPSHKGGLGSINHSQGLSSLSSDSSLTSLPLSSSKVSLVEHLTESNLSDTISKSTTNCDFSFTLPAGKNFSLETVDQIKLFLKEQIKYEEQLQLPATIPFYKEKLEVHERYLYNLTKTLEAIEDLPSFGNEENSNSIDAKISKSVSKILELSEAIQCEFDEFFDMQRSGKEERSSSGNNLIENAQEAINHFIRSLTDLNDCDKALENFYLGCKEEATFKEKRAFKDGGVKKNPHFNNLSIMYHLASELYKKAQEAITGKEYELSYDFEQAADMWMLAGEAFNDGDIKRYLLYKAAAHCFSDGAKRMQKGFEGSEEHLLLREAADNFYLATITDHQETSNLLKLLGTIQSDKAKALITHNSPAYLCFKEAEELINNMVDEKNEGESISNLIQDAINYAHTAGKFLLKNSMDRTPYQDALKLQKEAIEKYREGKKEIAQIYQKAVSYSCKAAKAQQNRLKVPQELWERTAKAHQMIAAEKDKGSENRDSIIRLFETAGKYNEIAAKEIEADPKLDRETAACLEEAASGFFLAAENLQKSNSQLAEAYRNYARSYYLLAVIRKPLLYQNLTETEKGVLGNKEPVPTPGLIEYWEKIVSSNNKILEDLKNQMSK